MSDHDGKARILNVGYCAKLSDGRWYATGWNMVDGPGVECDERGKPLRMGGYTFAELAAIYEAEATKR